MTRHDAREMQKSRSYNDSSTQASEPSSRESHSDTPEPTKPHTPHGTPTQGPFEAQEEYEEFGWGLDFFSQGPSAPPVILVMGVIGAGKSNFIQIVTGDSAVTVGHNLRSGKQPPRLYAVLEMLTILCGSPIAWGIGTRELQFHRKELGGEEYQFVDIPGFNDTERSESDIVCEISTALCEVQNIKGILYLHRISDDRMVGSSIRHLHIFQALCGKSCMRKVYILTTHWDRVDPEVGNARESELEEKYWKELISDGARVVQFRGSREEAEAITQCITQGPPVTLAIQDQLRNQGTFAETDAGIIVYEEMKKLRQRKEEELRLVREELAQQENSTGLGHPQTSRETILMAIIRSKDQIIKIQDENYADLERKYEKRGDQMQVQLTRSMKASVARQGTVSRWISRGWLTSW